MSLAYERAAPAVVPSPTRDTAQGLRNIAEFGLTIVPDVLGGDQLQRARDALYRAAESDRARGREQKFGLDYADDETNQRVWNVLSRDPVFEDLAFHRIAVDYVKAVLGGRLCSATYRPTSPVRAAAKWCCTPTRSSSPSRGPARRRA